jgi:hypothetical protein
MTTVTTSLLHDIEEYFVDNNVGPGKHPRLHHIGLLRRAHELIEDLEDRLYTVERRAATSGTACACWRMLDDNDDS